MCEIAFREEFFDSRVDDYEDFGVVIEYYRPAIKGNWSEPPCDEDIEFSLVDEDESSRDDILNTLTEAEVKSIKLKISEYISNAKAECELELALG